MPASSHGRRPPCEAPPPADPLSRPRPRPRPRGPTPPPAALLTAAAPLPAPRIPRSTWGVAHGGAARPHGAASTRLARGMGTERMQGVAMRTDAGCGGARFNSPFQNCHGRSVDAAAAPPRAVAAPQRRSPVVRCRRARRADGGRRQQLPPVPGREEGGERGAWRGASAAAPRGAARAAQCPSCHAAWGAPRAKRRRLLVQCHQAKGARAMLRPASRNPSRLSHRFHIDMACCWEGITEFEHCVAPSVQPCSNPRDFDGLRWVTALPGGLYKPSAARVGRQYHRDLKIHPTACDPSRCQILCSLPPSRCPFGALSDETRA